MTYYISKIVDMPFDDAVDAVTKSLSEQGFGILTEIDVQATLRKKLDVDFRKYKILGACNPRFAYKALEVEDKIKPRAYPNPYTKGSGSGLRITNVGNNSTVRIYTLSGKLVKVYKNVADEVMWNCANSDGNSILPGLYLCSVTDGDGNKKTTKVMIK